MSTQRFAKPLPAFFLDSAAANQRIQKFMDSKHLLLSDALERTDTKSIWYSFEHLQSLYKELIYLNADGLRIYFGAYSDDHPDYPGQLCLVMVPTRCDDECETYGSESNADVIMEEDVDFPARPGRSGADDARKALNYGAPCPTICPTQAGFIKYPFPTNS